MTEFYKHRRVPIDGVAYAPSRPPEKPIRKGPPMQATDNRCDLCAHWEYVHPDDMGVCTAHPENAKSFCVPIGQAVISKGQRERHRIKTATTCDTRCDAWRSDGTAKAREVERLRKATAGVAA